MKSTFKQGDTIAVIVKGVPLIGRLLSIKGSKAAVSFGGERRDQDLPLRDLIELTGADPDLIEASLPAPDEVQQRLPSRRTAAEAWWLLVSETSSTLESLSLIDLSELLVSPTDLAGIAAVWAWLHSDQEWFRWRRDRTVQPISVDAVRRHRQQLRRDQLAKLADDRERALLRESGSLSDEIRAQLSPRYQNVLTHLIALQGADAVTLRNDPEFSQWASDLGIDPDPAGLRQWLIQRCLIDPHEPSTLRGSVWSRSFTDELEVEAQRLVKLSEDACPGDDQRLDLTGLVSYSLDDPGTREIDDALSLETDTTGEWIWIHIADPSRLIPPGSSLDAEARRRATSLYLADGVLPMLPMTLAAGPLSLRAGVRSAALSVAVLLDDDGAIADQRVVRSWIQPRYGLSYEDGDELIELAPPGDESLHRLSALMQRRMAWRRRQGAVMFDRPEGRFRVREACLSLQVIDPSPARLLVSEAMLLMGAVIADFGRCHELPLPYRSQPAAELPSPSELDSVPEGPARDAAIKRCLSRGVQGTRPMPHFSLGLQAYVQATSPIRRYADLLAHRQILAVLGGEQPLEEAKVAEVIDDLADPLHQSIQISREDQRHWQQVWFSERVKNSWTALFLRWLRPQDRIALVHVPDLAMDLVGQVVEGNPQPGEPKQLRVGLADPERGELQLRLL